MHLNGILAQNIAELNQQARRLTARPNDVRGHAGDTGHRAPELQQPLLQYERAR